MYNDKIEIFILTYNRCDLLEAAIRSVLNQTVPARLTVVDNHSSDGTRALVEKINAEGNDIRFIERSVNGGWPGNFDTAKRYMSTPYVMLFSDDDIIHPQYVEFALRILAVEKDVSLVCSSSIPFYDNDTLCADDYKVCTYRSFDDARAFATYVFVAQVICPEKTPMFPNVIYRREYLENAVALDPLYGKIADRPFFIKGVEAGRAMLICEPMLFYRLHEGADTRSCKNPCKESELVNYMELFHGQAKERGDLLKMYYSVAGRNLKAIWNFTYGTVSFVGLYARCLRCGLLRIGSAFMLVDRFLHMIGMRRLGFFERLVSRELENTYQERRIEDSCHAH